MLSHERIEAIRQHINEALDSARDIRSRRSVTKPIEMVILEGNREVILRTAVADDVMAMVTVNGNARAVEFDVVLSHAEDFLRSPIFLEYEGGLEPTTELATLSAGGATVASLYARKLHGQEFVHSRRHFVAFRDEYNAERYLRGPNGQFMKTV